MNVIEKIKFFINTEVFLAYLIALVLSTIFLGYAPSSIALGLFVFFSIRYKIFNPGYVKITPSLLLPMFLYTFFLFTWFWTVDKSLTKTGLERTISLFLVPLAFALMPNVSLKNYKLILNTHTNSNILLGILFLASAFFDFFKTKSINAFTYHNLVSVLDLHAVYVSLSFSISLFYLMSKKINTKAEKIKILFFLVFLILLSSKTIIIVLFLSGIIYICNNRSSIKLSKKRVLSFLIVLVLILGISSITLSKRFLYEKNTKFSEVLNKKEFGNIYPWTGSSIRLLQLRILKEQIEEETIFLKGFGLFASRENIKKRHKEFGIYYDFYNYNYHNQYAQIFSEVGIIGLCFFLSMLLFITIKALKANNFLFIMFCVTIIMLFFTESLLWRQHGLFLFIILYCIFNRINIQDV